MRYVRGLDRFGLVLWTTLALLLGNVGSLSLAQSSAQTSSASGGSWPSLGRPNDKSRIGGASRGEGSCDAPDLEELTALVPSHGNGLTAQAQPDWFFFVPYDADNFHSWEFSLKNLSLPRGQQIIFEVAPTLDPAAEVLPGIVGISLKGTGINLVPGQDYQWKLTLYCDDPGIPAKAFLAKRVYGLIRYDEVPERLAQAATLVERISFYEDQGLWFDALGLAVALRAMGDAEAWTRLLTGVDLVDVVERSLVDCCTLPQEDDDKL